MANLNVLSVLGLSLLALFACVGSALCLRSCSRMATKMRSWHSIAAEQAEINDRLNKTDALLKRINARETMRERRGDDPPAQTSGLSLKDRLRIKAGITAGKPVRHDG